MSDKRRDHEFPMKTGFGFADSCSTSTARPLEPSGPKKIVAQGTDWRFLNELKKELTG